jgi:hypothetical protein
MFFKFKKYRFKRQHEKNRKRLARGAGVEAAATAAV